MGYLEITLAKRSFRLSSEDEDKEHKVFEGYGIHEESASDNYRKLLNILCENLIKGVKSPDAVYTTPDCKCFTEIQGQFYCVKGKKHTTINYKKTHLSICNSCVAQGCNDPIKAPIVEAAEPEPVLPEPAKVGELPDETEPTPLHPTEQFTPVKGYEKILFYMRSDGGKFCPFEKNLIVYRFNCVLWEEKHPEKYQACLTLRATAQISKPVDLRK
jgi:hypothetical protein